MPFEIHFRQINPINATLIENFIDGGHVHFAFLQSQVSHAHVRIVPLMKAGKTATITWCVKLDLSRPFANRRLYDFNAFDLPQLGAAFSSWIDQNPASPPLKYFPKLDGPPTIV